MASDRNDECTVAAPAPINLRSLAAAPPERWRVRLVRFPTRRVLAAAHDPEPDEGRELTIIEAHRGDIIGYGESSALNRPGYTTEWARGVFDYLRGESSRDPAWLRRLDDDHPHRFARSGVHMALLDLSLRTRHLNLHELLAHHCGQAPRRVIPAGAVISLGSPAATVEEALRLHDVGFDRLKLKLTPQSDPALLDALRRQIPGPSTNRAEIVWCGDGNGSFSRADLTRLSQWADSGLAMIEQPFPPGDPAAAELRAAISCAVFADEAATDNAAITALIDQGLADGIVIKPGRLGGLDQAIEVYQALTAPVDRPDKGIALTAGGMLESGLGRHALAALAGLNGFSFPGDLSPARQWLADDAWPDLVMTGSTIEIYEGIGIAPLPDPELLDRYTLESLWLPVG